MNWKKISSKKIFEHPRIALIEDTVVLPNKHETKYLKFGTKNDCVTVIPRKKDGKLLIEREYSYPPNVVMFQFPGGGIQDSETLEMAANRELMEEVSYEATKLTKIGEYYTNNRRSSQKMHVFLGEQLKKKSLVGDVEEEIKTSWVEEKEIEKMIRRGEIVNANLLASWSLLKAITRDKGKVVTK